MPPETDQEERYVKGIDFETGEYWVVRSEDGQGMTRHEAEAFVLEMGNWPWRISDETRKEFVFKREWLLSHQQ